MQTALETYGQIDPFLPTSTAGNTELPSERARTRDTAACSNDATDGVEQPPQYCEKTKPLPSSDVSGVLAEVKAAAAIPGQRSTNDKKMSEVPNMINALLIRSTTLAAVNLVFKMKSMDSSILDLIVNNHTSGAEQRLQDEEAEFLRLRRELTLERKILKAKLKRVRMEEDACSASDESDGEE